MVTQSPYPSPPTRRVGQTDVALSLLGFGGASVGNLYRASTDEDAQAALAAGVDAGLTYIDTAPFYGHGLSETRFGTFLGGVDRAGVQLSTKVGRVLDPAGPEGPPDNGFVDPLPLTPRYDYSYDGVMRSFEDSLARMGVETIDVLYMHDIGAMTHGEDAHPALFKQAMSGGYRAMAELKRAGRVGAIGLGVNEWQVCAESFAHADFDIFMLAGRYTLLEQEPLDSFLPECAKRGVSIVAAAPFNSGLLARRPDAHSHYNYGAVPDDLRTRAHAIFDICEAHGTTAQTAALQFALLHPCVVSVVSGMASAARVAGTSNWFHQPVPSGVWRDLKTQGLLHPDAPVDLPADMPGYANAQGEPNVPGHPRGTVPAGRPVLDKPTQ